jgi:hypothetical protein
MLELYRGSEIYISHQNLLILSRKILMICINSKK